MSDLFATDKQRARAAELRRLLLRLDNGDGADRDLGDAIMNAVAAPMTILDPTASMEDALALARFLGHSQAEILSCATVGLKRRVLGGWKSAEVIVQADVARAMLAIILRVELANLERAPA